VQHSETLAFRLRQQVLGQTLAWALLWAWAQLSVLMRPLVSVLPLALVLPLVSAPALAQVRVQQLWQVPPWPQVSQLGPGLPPEQVSQLALAPESQLALEHLGGRERRHASLTSTQMPRSRQQ
jgi:hypothetical protein